MNAPVFVLEQEKRPRSKVRRGGWSWGPVEAAKLRFPLLEARMSRRDCAIWLEALGYPVPAKSACSFCPYRSNSEWRWLRDNDPEGWAEALRVDQLVRSSPRMKHAAFLHRSLTPLGEIDLTTAEDRGQGMLMICEAGCGL